MSIRAADTVIKPAISPEMDLRLNKIIDLFSNGQEHEARWSVLQLPKEIGQPLLKQMWSLSPKSSLKPQKNIAVINDFLLESKKLEFASLSKKWNSYYEKEFEYESRKGRFQHLTGYRRNSCYDTSLADIRKGNFINAHLVFDRKYLLTEHPRRKTFPFFWQMIDDYSVPVIVMLNEPDERDCYPYIPETSAKYGLYTVTLKEMRAVDFSFNTADKTKIAEIAIRTLVYSRPGKPKKETTHIHFLTWQDGETTYPEVLYSLIKYKDSYLKSDSGPIVVHCRKGVLRTGVFCTIDSLFAEVKAKKPISVLSTVERLRHPDTGRHPKMINQEELYLFCYTTLWNLQRELQLEEEKKEDEPINVKKSLDKPSSEPLT